MILKFEKAINKNQEQRVRYADQPQKFMESEADLDEEIKNLATLTEAPHLYPEIVQLGSVPSIISLLSHENTDIAIDAIDLINELIDEDVGMGEDELERSEEATKGMKVLADALLENELLELLVQNLDRLDEKEESDRQGIFKILGIMESLLGLDPQLAERIALKTEIMPWLLKRIQGKGYDSNRGYASEILSILLQESRDIRLKLAELDGVDTLLRALSNYRKKDPVDDDETEMMENFFNTLCSGLNEPEIKEKFLEGEGNELMLIMLKERSLARIRAIKVLNYAMTSEAGRGNCLRFGAKKLKKIYSKTYVESEDEEHITCIILSLMRNLSQNDVQRIRLIKKFTEDDYEKIDRLLEMKQAYEAKDQRVREEIEKEKEGLDEEDIEDLQDDFYLRRLDAGLFTLQRVCLMVAALSKEDQGIRERTLMLLKRQGSDISSIFKIIEEETALMVDFSYLSRMAKGGSVESDEQRS
ncbi:Catenin-beta-like protein [Fennellomyces sp. T-0311]|nr:Catenin-beta-like protein [Fennellomyces sp. T-0311]